MKKPKNKEITISDLIPDMKRDIHRYLDEDIFEIAKEHDLSLVETEALQRFKEDNDFKNADKAYEAWSSDS